MYYLLFYERKIIIDTSNPPIVDRVSWQTALSESAVIVETFIKNRYEQAKRVQRFPGSLTAFIGYLISHESHHRGQMVLALKQAGLKPDKGLLMALWQGW